jgi:hypothetical protein
MLGGGEPGCLLSGCQQPFVGRWRHFLAGGAPPPGVVVLDPGRHRSADLCLGGEVLHPPQLELQGGVPRLDDRVVEGWAGTPHRLRNP